MDVTQEIEQRAQQAAQAGADHYALCSISCVTSTLASVSESKMCSACEARDNLVLNQLAHVIIACESNRKNKT